MDLKLCDEARSYSMPVEIPLKRQRRVEHLKLRSKVIRTRRASMPRQKLWGPNAPRSAHSSRHFCCHPGLSLLCARRHRTHGMAAAAAALGPNRALRAKRSFERHRAHRGGRWQRAGSDCFRCPGPGLHRLRGWARGAVRAGWQRIHASRQYGRQTAWRLHSPRRQRHRLRCG